MRKSPRLAGRLLAQTAIGAACSLCVAFRRAACFAANGSPRGAAVAQTGFFNIATPLAPRQAASLSRNRRASGARDSSEPSRAQASAESCLGVRLWLRTKTLLRRRVENDLLCDSRPARLANESKPHTVPFARHLRRDASSAEYRPPRLACICRRIRRTAREVLAYLLLVSPPAPQSLYLSQYPAYTLPSHSHYRDFYTFSFPRLANYGRGFNDMSLTNNGWTMWQENGSRQEKHLKLMARPILCETSEAAVAQEVVFNSPP